MAFSLGDTGILTTLEARERALTGFVSNTVDLAHTIDTTDTINEALSITALLDAFGVHFTSTDTVNSIYPDGSVEAQEFIEGARVYLDTSARLTVVFLTEEI